MPQCWKSHVTVQLVVDRCLQIISYLINVFTVTNNADPDKTPLLQDLPCNDVM